MNKKNIRAENGQRIGTEEKSQMANKHTKKVLSSNGNKM